MKKIVMCLLASLALAGCTSTSVDQPVKSDMSGYTTLEDENHVFYDLSVKQMAEKMDEKETFIVYFGFDQCAWCLEAVPILNETAKEYEMHIGYINTRANQEWKSNLDIDDYDVVVERLGEYLEYDNDGIRHLYTPHVFFIKDGQVVSDHYGSIEGHNAKEESLSEDEVNQLRDIYKEGFKELK